MTTRLGLHTSPHTAYSRAMEYRIRVTDYLWAAVAVLTGAATLAFVMPVLWNLVRNPSLARFVAFLVGTFLVVGVARWVLMGAWRRTAWGAPAGGVREVRERRGATTGHRD